MESRPGQDTNPSDETERLYRERVDCVPDWIWDIDTEGTLTFSNNVVESILGYTVSEVTGKPIFDFMVYDDAVKCRAVLAEAVRTKQPIRNVVHRSIARHGTVKTLESSCVPIMENDTLVGFRGISRDIIDELIFQRAAREALSNYRAVLESAPTLIVVIQGNRLVYQNPKTFEITGYAPQELAAMDPFEIVYLEDRERARDIYEHGIIGGKIPPEERIRIVTRSGEVRWLEIRSTVITYNGAPAFLYNSIDITERKQAEEALRASRERLGIQLAALTELTKKEVLASKDLDAALCEITETAARASNVERLSVWTFTEDRTKIVCLDLYELSKDRHSAGYELTVADYPTYFATIDESRVVAHDAVTAEYTREFADDYLRPHNITSMMDAAIRLRGQMVGMVCFEHTGPPRHWASDEVNFAADIANLAALTIETSNRIKAEEASLALERHLDEQKRLFYHETILSVTDGKLDICDECDISPYISSALIEADLQSASDVPDARHDIEKFCREHGLVGERLDMFVSGVGEAMANAIKHGVDAKSYAGLTDGQIWVAVSDRGKGIESLVLPHAVLSRGFSTKPSLGLGYSIMLDVADRILLSTSDQGTTVILIKSIEEPVPKIPIEQLPDTWASVPENRE